MHTLTPVLVLGQETHCVHHDHSGLHTCLQVANLGKSGVSVGYFDTEEAAAKAYDRAAIGLLGWESTSITLNFPKEDYQGQDMTSLAGKTREEVKLQLKHERSKVGL